MSAAVSRAQIVAIHALKSRAGLSEEAYREELAQLGVASSTELSHSAAIGLIDHLKGLAKQPRGTFGGRPQGAMNLDGPYVGICRALWLDGYHLGLIEHPEDTALVAFVRRQTRIDHLNWVRDAVEGSKVVEALKAWLHRDGGVDWTSDPKFGRVDRREPADRVIAAQVAMLGVSEAMAAGRLGLLHWQDGKAGPGEKLALIKALGSEIRRRKVAG